MSAEHQPIEMAIPVEIAESRTRTRRFLTIEMRNRYTALLVVIVAMMLVLPLIAGDELALFSMKVAVSIILVFGIYVGRRLRRDLVVGAALGIPVLVGRWMPQYALGTATDELRVLQFRDVDDDRVWRRHAGGWVSRAISVLEAVAGQFFLAILIARLVSLEIIHSMDRGRE